MLESNQISKRLKSCVSKFYPIVNLKVIFLNTSRIKFFSIQRLPESFPRFPESLLRSFTRQVAGIAMTSTSEKRSGDFKIGKLNILKPKKNKNTHQLLLITSKPRT